MSERPTPETDAAKVPWYGDKYVVVDIVSKKLERERDEAREDAKHWCEMHILAVKDFNEARELARELRDALQPTLTSLIGRMVINDTDTVERAHLALNKAKEVLP